MADSDPEAGKKETEPDTPEAPDETAEGAEDGPTQDHVESLTGDAPAENDPDQNRMTMMEHLVELRRRLMWCVVALLVAFGVCVFFA